ncbi:YidC/Oxa1 family membrane protein insertase [Streptomyces sp. NPDC060194]|uniref:YidC/Oxa1 family membrane protein insertase n=1 Tax=Streptomyces sp. NPDC060194 TaxID=3347069 RepID=UPI00364AC891
MTVFADLVEHLADLLEPLFAASAAAAAIVLFTMCVRLAIHPLSRAAARGQKAKARLAPQIAALRKKHGKDPQKLQKAIMALHAEEKVSPAAGCLPSLLQAPAFLLMYHLFSNRQIGGEPNTLLGHELLAAPLGGRWHDALADGGPFGPAGLVYLALFAIVLAVATFNYRRTKTQLATVPSGAAPAAPGMASMTRIMPFMSFLTLLTVVAVPLAAALYVVTSAAWSAAERYFLYRDMPSASATAAGALA